MRGCNKSDDCRDSNETEAAAFQRLFRVKTAKKEIMVQRAGFYAFVCPSRPSGFAVNGSIKPRGVEIGDRSMGKIYFSVVGSQPFHRDRRTFLELTISFRKKLNDKHYV